MLEWIGSESNLPQGIHWITEPYFFVFNGIEYHSTVNVVFFEVVYLVRIVNTWPFTRNDLDKGLFVNDTLFGKYTAVVKETCVRANL
jgi:hypothetical protein